MSARTEAQWGWGLHPSEREFTPRPKTTWELDPSYLPEGARVRIGSLFAGIGVFEYGVAIALAERGIASEVVWQVELEPLCRAVLVKHWPAADRTVPDVKKASRANLAPVDLICGGFPCQDISSAGKGAGLAGNRSGLWGEYRRIVQELRPGVVAVENVASGKSRWLPTVVADLEALGYHVEAPRTISAADVGAPHTRRRVFVLAHAGGVGGEREAGRDELSRGECAGRAESRGGGSERADVAHTDEGRRTSLWSRRQLDRGERAPRGHDVDRRGGEGGPALDGWADAESGLGRGSHGAPGRVDRDSTRLVRWPAGRGERQHAWEPPRAIGSGGVPNHAERLAALGNAIVLDVAIEVGRWIVNVMRR